MIDLDTHSDLILLRKLKQNGHAKSDWQGSRLPSPNADWCVVFHDPNHHKKFSNGQQTRADIFFFHFLNLQQPIAVLISFDLNGRFQDAKIDAALPAKQLGSTVEFVDLDLDLIVLPDFSYSLRDEETFQTNTVEMGYSQEIINTAWAGIELGRQLITCRQFPFDKVGQQLMQTHLPLH